MIAEVARLAAELRAEHPDWREGQAAFNALVQVDPACAESVRHMPVDPFYNDAKLPVFWEYLRNWYGE